MLAPGRAIAADFARIEAEGGMPDIDYRRFVLLDRADCEAKPELDCAPDVAAAWLGGAEAGSAKILRYDNTLVDIEAVAPAQGGFLVLNDVWQDWQAAYVDGLPAPILRANLMFRAFASPRGRIACGSVSSLCAGSRSSCRKIGAGRNPAFPAIAEPVATARVAMPTRAVAFFSDCVGRNKLSGRRQAAARVRLVEFTGFPSGTAFAGGLLGASAVSRTNPFGGFPMANVTFSSPSLSRDVTVYAVAGDRGTLLSLAKDSKIPIPFDCQDGECGSCLVEVTVLSKSPHAISLTEKEKEMLKQLGKISKAEVKEAEVNDLPPLRLACQYSSATRTFW